MLGSAIWEEGIYPAGYQLNDIFRQHYDLKFPDNFSVISGMDSLGRKFFAFQTQDLLFGDLRIFMIYQRFINYDEWLTNCAVFSNKFPLLDLSIASEQIQQMTNGSHKRFRLITTSVQPESPYNFEHVKDVFSRLRSPFLDQLDQYQIDLLEMDS